MIGAGVSETKKEKISVEPERSWSERFFIAPIIAQFLHYSSVSNDEEIAGKNVLHRIEYAIVTIC
jgi:hypothetical protein